MGNQLIRPYRVSDLAQALGLSWKGIDLEITHVRSLDVADAGALCFAKAQLLSEILQAVALIAPMGTEPGTGAVIESTNPRLAFAKALIALTRMPGFKVSELPPQLGDGAIVSPTAALGGGVIVGARSIIGHNVVLADGVRIGEDCVIKSNTVIGEAGFGFERDESGVPVRIPHLGGVVIGNRVEIGSLNTVCRATLGDTVIEDDVKTDDHVHIAHNCRVRRGALLTACVELSGGVDIGEFAWVGPNTSVIQKAVLGSNSFVGIGSNITKSIPDGAIVAGNPARIIRHIAPN
jgi:UDP-3-O-[3-hydroxymyristoyl] glucosamine N-acyltransferase